MLTSNAVLYENLIQNTQNLELELSSLGIKSQHPLKISQKVIDIQNDTQTDIYKKDR